jgi:hypothetical protein
VIFLESLRDLGHQLLVRSTTEGQTVVVNGPALFILQVGAL